MMLGLGDYRFSVDRAAYQELRRVTDYRWPSQERIGRTPARQFVGPGDDRQDLEGVIYPHFRGGPGQLDAMREEAAQGTPLLLVDGEGRIHGRWVIERVEETKSVIDEKGRPRRQQFRLTIAFYGDDR
ncbi:phage tail protein [Vibrio injensis]|uniref:phage tail protein n=1 Tax=Vibrio injensis TaxID=1307414 RepID=UPI0009324C59|nr:phage tail protein [Vibrio injensis]